MAELFKFRCYQCQKLIGAPQSRFGSVVKCPKCGVELIVPSPNDEPKPEPEPDPDAVRLEDLGLRLDPEPISKPISKPTVASISPLAPIGPDPVAFLNRLDEVGESPPASEAADGQAEELGEPEQGADVPLDLPEPEVEPLISRKRARTASQIAGPAPRSRDVVLPRTAAVAWALFGLLGLAFAFLAGLLLGQRLGK
jgi:hypothetical protein